MTISKMNDTLDFIRSLYPDETPVPLHAPRFLGNEKKYLCECIDTTFVSYVGKFVTDFENHIKTLTGCKHAIAVVNGTAALQLAFTIYGITDGDLVLTQALTFAATASSIKQSGAMPVFIDVDRDSLGLSPEKLRKYLEVNAVKKGDLLLDRETGRRYSAIVPMHTFGHPAEIDEIVKIAEEYKIPLIEDAAESLGSYYRKKHTGTFGNIGIFSFNGNKPVTTGGGGMLITDDDELAAKARHLSTTAKVSHKWNFFHDEVGFNLRMPNINAAVGCAQIERFDDIINNKRYTASLYSDFFDSIDVSFISESPRCKANYWLNSILLENLKERDTFLEFSNSNGVQTRPAWTLMHKLPPYSHCPRGELDVSLWLEERLINIPSSYRFTIINTGINQ